MNTKTRPIVIAHRGASGYLPEHTLASKALAHGMGADFLEQDVVLSKDGVPVVLHDIYLDCTTDVADCYPGRHRDDGRYYAIEFNLEELRSLSVHERTDPDTGTAVYPDRFPAEYGLFTIPTLLEEIHMIAGLDRSSGRRTGLYIELKAPNWHRAQGADLSAAILKVLRDTGYDKHPERIFLQCFDNKTLRELHRELAHPLPLIQLIAENSWGEDSEVDYDYLRTAAGLTEIATYANGIGPFLPHIYRGKTPGGSADLSELVSKAHALGLVVHPYTFRRDELPEGISSFEDLLDIFIQQAGVDGLFTDFPDLLTGYLRDW